MPRQVLIPQKTITEEIRSIEEIPGQVIRVLVGVVDESGEFIVPQNFMLFEIKDADMIELLSENPLWAPGKPADTYRNDDLWQFIDRIRARQS